MKDAAGLKRIRKGGARINKTKACISVSPVILKALHKKAASYGKSLSAFIVEAGSHYTPKTSGVVEWKKK